MLLVFGTSRADRTAITTLKYSGKISKQTQLTSLVSIYRLVILTARVVKVRTFLRVSRILFLLQHAGSVAAEWLDDNDNENYQLYYFLA